MKNSYCMTSEACEFISHITCLPPFHVLHLPTLRCSSLFIKWMALQKAVEAVYWCFLAAAERSVGEIALSAACLSCSYKVIGVLIFLIETDFYQAYRNLIFLRLAFGCKMSTRTLTNGQKNEIKLWDPHFLGWHAEN